MEEIASILCNEAELLHCSLREAWDGMAPYITEQYNYEDVVACIEEMSK